MNNQAIQSQDLSVRQLFQNFYVVPSYQREYVWQKQEVEQLLFDIFLALGDIKQPNATEYFIGTIVVCQSKNEAYELIDGQQRTTTLFLILCAIKDRLSELDGKLPGELQHQIATTATDLQGHDEYRYRLELQYEDSESILAQIAQGTTERTHAATLTVRNLLAAHKVAYEFFCSQFGEDPAAVRVFYAYLLRNVKIIRIEAQDITKALKVFETVNDRGRGLTSMDLLKNLLFIKADRKSFEKLKSIWGALQDTIFEMQEKPLRFLRYFVFSEFGVEKLREEEIYSWMKEHEGDCGYADDPVSFAKGLFEVARIFQNFLNGQDVSGKPNRYLENIRILGGKTARQHLILLLAGRHLPPVLFDRLAREVENLFFVYVITRENMRDFERRFARWAIDLRNVSTDAAFESFIEERFGKVKIDLAGRFEDALSRLTSKALQQYKMKYVLGKLSQHIDMLGYGETNITSSLSHYVGDDFEIEHILPQNPSPAAAEEFGEGDLQAAATQLGNLLLVEKSINASLGNKPFSKKRSIFGESRILLTKCTGERTVVGTNTLIDRAAAAVPCFEYWNFGALDARQRFLGKLACKVWEVTPN